jgi:hypothetical protein
MRRLATSIDPTKVLTTLGRARTCATHFPREFILPKARQPAPCNSVWFSTEIASPHGFRIAVTRNVASTTIR